jgi:hypothetical protein
MHGLPLSTLWAPPSATSVSVDRVVVVSSLATAYVVLALVSSLATAYVVMALVSSLATAYVVLALVSLVQAYEASVLRVVHDVVQASQQTD